MVNFSADEYFLDIGYFVTGLMIPYKRVSVLF